MARDGKKSLRVRTSHQVSLFRAHPPAAASENAPNDDDEWEHSSDLYVRNEDDEDDEEKERERPWQRQPVHYVYDAVAERRAEQQRIAEQLKGTPALVNGVR